MFINLEDCPSILPNCVVGSVSIASEFTNLWLYGVEYCKYVCACGYANLDVFERFKYNF